MIGQVLHYFQIKEVVVDFEEADEILKSTAYKQHVID